MTEPSTDLEPMPDDWQRALAIVAHPDDLEYGASSAIARWTDEGRSVTYLLVSRGEAGIDTIAPGESGPLRSLEQIAAAAAVGVDIVEFLDHPDGLIEYGVPLRRDLTAAIRRHRPELVVSLNHHDTFPGGFRNMADHRHVGLAVLDAVRDAGNRWLFQDLDGEPWNGVRWVALSGSPHATHAVDITSTFDRGVASLQAHATYLEALGNTPEDTERMLRGMAEGAAAQFGGRLATSFELITIAG